MTKAGECQSAAGLLPESRERRATGLLPKFKGFVLKSQKADFLNLPTASKFNPSRNQHHSQSPKRQRLKPAPAR
jgi:hypothetical protein